MAIFRKSVNTILIGSVSLAVTVAIAGLVFYVSTSSHRMALQLEEQNLAQSADTLAKSIGQFLDDTASLAGTLADQAAVVAAFTESDPKRADERLKSYLESYKDTYWAMFAFDLSGKVVAGYNANMETMAGSDRASRDYVKAVIGGKDSFISDQVLEAQSGQNVYILAVSQAVKDTAGKLVGGVAVFPKWSVFTAAFLDPIRFGARGYGFIMDKSGVILAHAADKSLITKNLSEHEFIRKTLALKSGSLDYDWKGEAKILAVRSVPQTGWAVCMSAYTAELTETATAQRNVLAAVGLGVIILLVGVILFVSRSLILGPLLVIQAFTRQVASGDYKAELAGSFKYELADLAADIRHMVGEIKAKLGFTQGILSGMTNPCLGVDTDSKITFVNQPTLDMLEHGGRPESYVGQGMSEFFYADAGRTSAVTKVMASGEPIKNLDVELAGRKGGKRFIRANIFSLHDLDGKLIGGFCTYADLTEIKLQQQKIEDQNKVIAQAAVAATQIADQVASAAEELAAQIEESSRGTEIQRSRTGEAATAMEEMNASVLEVARNAGAAADLADRAKAKAQEGSGVVEEVVKTITRVNDQATALKGDMTEMGRQAEGIGAIMNVISDIADQTNLLALNAAIEAARAGDAGRGFAVVADEVRKLAEKTMSATSEVGSSVRAVQDRARKNIAATEETTKTIAASTQLASRSGTALQEIVGMVEVTADQVRSIATASEEQSAASEEINRSTEEINRIASETAEAMNQSASAVSDLSRLAQELKRIISDMQQ